MPLTESKFLLNSSKETLSIITEYYYHSLEDKEISLVLKLKIKHFLEDVKSAFDYTAFVIFNKYCSQYVTNNLEDHKRGVYFPVKFKKENFNKYVRDTYPNLKDNHSNIHSIFEDLQPYNNNHEWFRIMNSLVNNNKHRSFTPQTKEESVPQIETFDNQGNKLSSFPHGGIHIANSFGVLVDGMEWDQEKQVPISNKERTVLVTKWVDFVFTDLQKSVLPLLNEIQKQSELVISNLEKEIL